MSSSGRILVTPRSLTAGGHRALDPLSAAGYEVVFGAPGKAPDEAELLALLPGCVGYLAGVEKIGARVLEAAVGLRVISRNGVGVDNVDLAAAQRLGIRVCAAAGANARGVVELTLGLILALVRSIPHGDATLKTRSWKRHEGIELHGRTLGVIGCGRIGSDVAKIAVGLGMRVVIHDPMVRTVPCHGCRLADFAGVLAEAEVLTLHCPPRDDGLPLIDAAALGRMRPGAYLVNTARANLVDPAAVRAALDSGRLSGLAVDVFTHEPPVDDPLVAHPRVIATPHVGGFTRESIDRAAAAAVENLLRQLATC